MRTLRNILYCSFVTVWLMHLVTMPFKFIIGLCVSWLWFPAATTTQSKLSVGEYKEQRLIDDVMKLRYVTDVVTKRSVGFEALATDAVDVDTPNKPGTLFEDGDNLKFVGMLAAVSPQLLNTRLFRWIMRCFSIQDGTNRAVLGRYPEGDIRRDTAANISGDMFSGVGLMLASMLTTGAGISDADKHTLKTWFQDTVSTSPILMFRHPVLGTDTNQGLIYSFYESTSGLSKLLLWLMLAYKITNEKKYLFWYYMFFIVHLPVFFIPWGDANIVLGRFYIAKWHTYHSRYLNLTSLYLLTGNWFYKHNARQVYKRYGEWNLDISSLWYKVFLGRTKIINTMPKSRLRTRFLDGWMDVISKGNEYYTDGFAAWSSFTYLMKAVPNNVRKFFTKNDTMEYMPLHESMANAMFIPTKCIGQSYVFEKSPLKPSRCSQEYRETRCEDLLFSWYVMQKDFTTKKK